jgi:hypothetical protein
MSCWVALMSNNNNQNLFIERWCKYRRLEGLIARQAKSCRRSRTALVLLQFRVSLKKTIII